MKAKIKVGVSRCLLGDAVRYDGRDSGNAIIREKLAARFELIAVCPEVEAGFAVPRPPVQLSGSIDTPRLTGRDDPTIDVTDSLLAYCQHRPEQLTGLNGYIFKSRSPSCGLNTTPVYINGECVTEQSRGVFARALCERFPGMPVIEDTELEHGLPAFFDAVEWYYRDRVG